jgi:putative ABC transport system substrate-binding protein
MRRRTFMAGLGAAAAWPLAARAQQPALPVIGSLCAVTEAQWTSRMVSFRGGLREAGYVEGRNLGIEYRWADVAQGQTDTIPL